MTVFAGKTSFDVHPTNIEHRDYISFLFSNIFESVTIPAVFPFSGFHLKLILSPQNSIYRPTCFFCKSNMKFVQVPTEPLLANGAVFIGSNVIIVIGLPAFVSFLPVKLVDLLHFICRQLEIEDVIVFRDMVWI